MKPALCGEGLPTSTPSGRSRCIVTCGGEGVSAFGGCEKVEKVSLRRSKGRRWSALAAEPPWAMRAPDCARWHPSWKLVLGRNVRAEKIQGRSFSLQLN
jgi:hypothetical protein